MAGEAAKAHDPLVDHLPNRLVGAARCGDLFDLFLRNDVVMQDELDVIGAHELEAGFHFAHGAVVVAFSNLGLDEDPYEVDPVRLRDVRVWGTVYEGRVYPVTPQ